MGGIWPCGTDRQRRTRSDASMALYTRGTGGQGDQLKDQVVIRNLTTRRGNNYIQRRVRASWQNPPLATCHDAALWQKLQCEFVRHLVAGLRKVAAPPSSDRPDWVASQSHDQFSAEQWCATEAGVHQNVADRGGWWHGAGGGASLLQRQQCR